MALATTGYANLKSFQKAEVMVAPSITTEGKDPPTDPAGRDAARTGAGEAVPVSRWSNDDRMRGMLGGVEASPADSGGRTSGPSTRS